MQGLHIKKKITLNGGIYRIMIKKILKRVISGVAVGALLLGSVVVPTGKTQAATETLLNTYGSLFGRSGTCINSYQMNDSNTMNHVKSQYNSITLENEMKPDALLGYSPSLISKDQAKSMGYYVPANCTESYLPRINFDTIDKVLKKCYENGIGVRAHTLVWHSQTPAWFFRTGYSTNYGYVSQSQMDIRMEYYIKTVMGHVYQSQYGSVVYCWDVVNEYLHATDSGWEAVYGKGGTRPGFVKKAFQYAYDTLSYFKLTGKVSLFYNDFNTYMEVNDVIALVNFINSSGKICNGVGMQSHLGTTFPSVDYYTSALRSFVNAGFEVQITELDVTNKSDTDQADYLYKLMKNVLALKKSGARITGITYWGLSDQVTWIRNAKPLLFSSLGKPKSAYYSVIQAYKDAGYKVGGSQSSSGSQQGGSTASVTAASINNGWYFIKNTNSQKYLTVAGNKGADGTNVEIRSGNGTDSQKWYVSNVGDGYVTLKNALGYNLDVQYGSKDNGANIQTYSANGADAQKFKIAKTSKSGVYGITTKVTNDAKALDVYNFGTSDGVNVCQWAYAAGTNQTWTFEAVNTASSSQTISNGWYYIKNVNAQKYLQVAGNQSGRGVNVEIGTGTGVSGQRWYVENTSDGYVTLKNGNGCMLDVCYGKADDGTNIQTYTANGENAQKFKIQKTSTANVYGITTKISGDKKGLDVYNWGTSDGANVCQWAYYANKNQQWIFERIN